MGYGFQFLLVPIEHFLLGPCAVPHKAVIDGLKNENWIVPADRDAVFRRNLTNEFLYLIAHHRTAAVSNCP
jgi:hypothetical protein